MAKFWIYYDRFTRPVVPAALGFLAGTFWTAWVMGEALVRGAVSHG